MQPKIFVLHVKSGYQERKVHIDSMMSRMGLDFEYILDGDIEDLTPQRLELYFDGPMKASLPATSCACKHLLAYERMVAEHIDSALVLEDDIFLSGKFLDVLHRAMAQTKGIDGGFYVSFEATCLRLVPRSERRSGQVVYPADNLQCMGAYYCNLDYARSVLNSTIENRCTVPFDHYVGLLGAQKTFGIFWSYPVVAQQGSHNGRMSSSIGNSVTGNGFMIRIKRNVSMFYKHILYFFR